MLMVKRCELAGKKQYTFALCADDALFIIQNTPRNL